MAHGKNSNIMITLNMCKEVLNNGTRKFNSEEIRTIRDYLYFVGQLEMENNDKEFFRNESDTLLPC